MFRRRFRASIRSSCTSLLIKKGDRKKGNLWVSSKGSKPRKPMLYQRQFQTPKGLEPDKKRQSLDRSVAMGLSCPIRILIVEDHPVFREGLNMILSSQSDMTVVGQAATSPEAIAEFRLHKPDVTLIDQRLPGASGTEALITIREEFPLARIIILTTCDGDLIIQRALRAGAAAYVLKSTPKSELLKIIRSVHSGQKHIPAEIASRLAEHLSEDN